MRQFDVFRGGVLLGRITLDDKEPGGLFEPSQNYAEVKELFERESQYSHLAANCDDPARQNELQRIADEALEAILAPGVRMRELGRAYEFDLVGLMIDGDRAMWR